MRDHLPRTGETAPRLGSKKTPTAIHTYGQFKRRDGAHSALAGTVRNISCLLGVVAGHGDDDA